jgi:hypothetical protein
VKVVRRIHCAQVLKHNFIGTRAEAWIYARQREDSRTCLEYIGGESISKSQQCSLSTGTDLCLQLPRVCSICITLVPASLCCLSRELRVRFLLCRPDCMSLANCCRGAASPFARCMGDLLGLSDLDSSFSWPTNLSKSSCRCSLFARAFFWRSGLYLCDRLERVVMHTAKTRYLEYLLLRRRHPHDQRGATDAEECTSTDCQHKGRGRLGGRQTYAEMALTYVPIAGMMGNWMTLDGYEWVCCVLLDLGGFLSRNKLLSWLWQVAGDDGHGGDDGYLIRKASLRCAAPHSRHKTWGNPSVCRASS